ncbi:MAG: DUF2730 family protein [Rhodobacteraceae bacterium]|nr:DUF2730 family protein [Paracoccaceae bacterium]
MTEVLTLSPLIAWIGALSLLLNFGLSVYSLLASGSRANRQRLDGHEARLNEHDSRLATTEQALRAMPAKDDLHGLQLALTEVRGDLREMRAIMGRMETIISRHEDHLLEGGKR